MWEEYVSELKLSESEKAAVKISSAPKDQRCPYFLSCGGCQLLNWDYSKQLAWKKKELEKLFYREVDVLGSIQHTAYRHKNSFSYKTQKYITTGGFYKANSKTLIPVEHCLIQHPKAELIFLSLLKIMKENRIEAFDDGRQTGVIRHAVIRISESTQDIMLILVTGLSPYPGRKNFMAAIRKKHPEITTIIENLQVEASPYLLGNQEEVMFGKGIIIDELLGHQFYMTSRSFFQVHPLQAEVLFKEILAHADLRKTDTLADVYAGVGVIGLLMARQVSKVYSVESNLDSVQLAKKNAELNQIANLKFVRQDATEWLAQMNEPLDVVVMDPPREGATEKFMRRLKEKAPRQIIYISCNPLTQKRDLEVLESTYTLVKLFGVDLFPQTVHLESVALLTRK